jgi:hypothetical protein
LILACIELLETNQAKLFLESGLGIAGVSCERIAKILGLWPQNSRSESFCRAILGCIS